MTHGSEHGLLQDRLGSAICAWTQHLEAKPDHARLLSSGFRAGRFGLEDLPKQLEGLGSSDANLPRPQMHHIEEPRPVTQTCPAGISGLHLEPRTDQSQVQEPGCSVDVLHHVRPSRL